MYVTVDVGNDMTRISGFRDLDIATVIFTEKQATHPLYATELKKIVSTVQRYAEDNPVRAVSISHTGTLNNRGTMVGSAHLPDYIDKNLKEDIAEQFNATTYIENDSVCATIAEAYFGKSKQKSSVAAIYLSSGIGGSYLKRSSASYSVFAAEIGHQIIVLNGKVCGCGQRGCLEAYVGARSIKKRFLMNQEELSDLRIWEEIVEYMAVGVANMYNMFGPEEIVLTGETARDIPFIQNTLIEKVYSRLNTHARDKVAVVLSDFYEMGPSYGALAVIKIKAGGNTIRVIE